MLTREQIARHRAHTTFSTCAGSLAGAPRRVRRAAARGQLKRTPLKPGRLVKPRSHWPPWQGGFSMQPVQSSSSIPEYAYVESPGYQVRVFKSL